MCVNNSEFLQKQIVDARFEHFSSISLWVHIRWRTLNFMIIPCNAGNQERISFSTFFQNPPSPPYPSPPWILLGLPLLLLLLLPEKRRKAKLVVANLSDSCSLWELLLNTLSMHLEGPPPKHSLRSSRPSPYTRLEEPGMIPETTSELKS